MTPQTVYLIYTIQQVLPGPECIPWTGLHSRSIEQDSFDSNIIAKGRMGRADVASTHTTTTDNGGATVSGASSAGRSAIQSLNQKVQLTFQMSFSRTARCHTIIAKLIWKPNWNVNWVSELTFSKPATEQRNHLSRRRSSGGGKKQGPNSIFNIVNMSLSLKMAWDYTLTLLHL